VPDGTITETLTCSGCEGDGCVAQLYAGVDSFSIISQTTPPALAFTAFPSSGSAIGASPFTISGTLQSTIPNTGVWFGNSSDGIDSDVSISTYVGPLGGSWSIQFSTDDILLFGYYDAPNSGYVSLSGSSADILRNTDTGDPVYAPPFPVSPGLKYDPSLATYFYIDGTPPDITLTSPAGGFSSSMGVGDSNVSISSTIASLPALSGVVQDDYQLGSLYMVIQDTTAGTYWVAASSSFASSIPSAPIQIPINTSPRVDPSTYAASAWTYNGLSDRMLAPNHSYIITLVATDNFNNVSTTTLTLSFEPVIATTLIETGLDFFTNGLFNFDALTLQWGDTGQDQALTVHVPAALRSSLSLYSLDGAIKLDHNAFQSSDDTFIANAAPGSCQLSGKVGIFSGGPAGTLLASDTIPILAPNSDTATKLNANVKDYADFPQGIEIEVYDKWLMIFANPGSAAAGITGKEVQSDEQPLIQNGVLMKMCPVDTEIKQQDYAPIAGGFTDEMAFLWLVNQTNNQQHRGCGTSSTQGETFRSFLAGSIYAECTFISGITKTKQLDYNLNIKTCRSDDANNTCPGFGNSP